MKIVMNLFFFMILLQSFFIGACEKHCARIPWSQVGYDDGSWALSAVATVVTPTKAIRTAWPKRGEDLATDPFGAAAVSSKSVSQVPSHTASSDSFLDADPSDFQPIICPIELLMQQEAEQRDACQAMARAIFIDLYGKYSLMRNYDKQRRQIIDERDRAFMRMISYHRLSHFLLESKSRFTVMHARWGSVKKKCASLPAWAEFSCIYFLNRNLKSFIRDKNQRHALWQQCVTDHHIVEEYHRRISQHMEED